MIVVGAISAAMYWWYVMRDASSAVGEAVSTAQRIRGNVTRRRFRAKAQKSAFDAIDDPVVAAATLAIATADQSLVDIDRFADVFGRQLEAVASPAAVEEALIYGKWAIRDAGGSSSAARLIGPKLVEFLTTAEREQYVAMVQATIEQLDPVSPETKKHMRHFQQKLGLVTH